MGLRDSHEKTEQSIKARKHELYAEETHADTGPQKPLSAYLKDTPPTPLSLTSKIILWAVAILVGLLFFAALLAPRTQPPRPGVGLGEPSAEWLMG